MLIYPKKPHSSILLDLPPQMGKAIVSVPSEWAETIGGSFLPQTFADDQAQNH